MDMHAQALIVVVGQDVRFGDKQILKQASSSRSMGVTLILCHGIKDSRTEQEAAEENVKTNQRERSKGQREETA